MALELLLVVAILSISACAVSLAVMPQVELQEPTDALGLDDQTVKALHEAFGESGAGDATRST